MLFGVVIGAAAGFLLTAAPTWSGRPALSGGRLAALFGLWLAGRVAMAAAGRLPTSAVAAVDAAFLPALAASLAWTLRGSANRRNHGIVAVVFGLAVANGLVHAAALGIVETPVDLAGRALRLSVHGMVVLLLVIGGRITPAFTANALRRAGSPRQVRSRVALDRLAVAAAVGFLIADALAPRGPVGGALALVAGLAAAGRMAGWQTVATLRDPLLWSLHAGLAWVAVGLLGVGAADLGAPIPPSAGLHALTSGAMGTTILAVATRVPLGHTGRPLVLPRGVVACYALAHAGALVRVGGALVPGSARVLLPMAGVLWAGSFALFAMRYAPILLAPRVDGRPG
jgi:uncharacterized protein involved in response to NO